MSNVSNVSNGSGKLAATNLTGKGDQLASEASSWLANNSLDILIAAAIGALIALFLIGIRSLGCKMIASRSGDTHWPTIFGRVVAKTKVFFIIMVSAALVAEHASTPPAILNVIHILFVIAAAIQAAIWARELILGFIEHRVGASEEHSTLGSAVGIIRLLVTVAVFAIGALNHLRQALPPRRHNHLRQPADHRHR
jgi:hypothetical protein